MVNGVEVVGSSAADAVAASPLTRLLSSSVKRLTTSDAPSGQSRVTAVAVETPCAISGTFTLDQTSTTSATIGFNNCSDIGGETVNGSLTVGNINGTATNFSASVGISLTISETGFADLQFGGNFNLAFAAAGTIEAITLNGSSLSLVSGTHAIAISNFNIVNTTDTANATFDSTGSFNIASTRLNGSVSVLVSTDFHRAGGRIRPSQGVLTATGAAGHAVRLTVLTDETGPANGQVRIEVDTGGGFGAPVDMSWTDLDA